MSTKEPRNWACLQRFLGPVRPPPPRVPIGAPPEGPARSLAVIVPSGQHETAPLQGLAALGTGRGVVGHTTTLSGAVYRLIGIS